MKPSLMYVAVLLLVASLPGRGDVQSLIDSTNLQHPQMSVHDNTFRHLHDKKHAATSTPAPAPAATESEGSRATRYLAQKIKTEPKSRLAVAYRGLKAAKGTPKEATAQAEWNQAVAESLKGMK